MKHQIRNIMLLLATVVLFSCGKDYQSDIDKLNAQHTSIEERVSALEKQVATVNNQLPKIAALASAAEQGFYITQVKTTSESYELTLSDGRVIVLQNTPSGLLVPMPAISMTKISGFYYWTLGGVLLTGTDGKPLSTNSPAPVVRFDFTLNQWVISVDGGTTFKNINEYVSIVINDTVLMQVINSYVSQHSTMAISQTVLFQILSTYIQQNYKDVFNIDLLDKVVATYIKEHYTRIFSYELLEKIFTQYNYSYVKENIKVDELVSVIIKFIREHKEVFVNNEVLYSIITNYIEVNKTSIFTNQLLLEVINNFLEKNDNFIDVNLLTQVVNNYIDQHTDVVFNTETVRTILTEYVQKWYVQIFSQDILIRMLNTYITQHTETIFNRTLIEEVINNYIQNNYTSIITNDRLVEIINNYLKVNSTTLINREVLVDVITQYFEKHYDIYIKREDILSAINTYITTHQTTLVSVEVISEIVNNYLTLYFREVFTVDLLKRVIIDYFREHTEVITREFNVGNDIIRDVKVSDDLCTVTLSDGKTIQLVVYEAYTHVRDRVQSIVAKPNSNGHFDSDVWHKNLYLQYMVTPSNMAPVIADLYKSDKVSIEIVYTDGNGSIDRMPATSCIAYGGELVVEAWPQVLVGAVALYVKDATNGGTDIMTEFTPIDYEGQKQSYLTCPDDNHPHMIDLGLPSGTLWACCNVGATYPKEYGGYYAWGEVAEKNEYTSEGYEAPGDFERLLLDISGTTFDVASVKWGESWRMPTREQMQELIDNCECTPFITTYIGGSGPTQKWLEFSGSNGGHITLPRQGYKIAIELQGDLAYWTSSITQTMDRRSYTLNFVDAVYVGQTSMYWGLPVRPVATP
jgi:hypothetical protein